MLINLLLVFTCRGKKVYEPPRFMTVNTAISQLLEVEEARGGSGRIFEPPVLLLAFSHPLRRPFFFQTVALMPEMVYILLLNKYSSFTWCSIN